MSKKIVIAFEGIEGSGKSFHINNVSKYLKKNKIDHIKLREPGGSVNSEKIRKLILNNKSDFNKNTDLLLYLAARSENVDFLKKFYKKKVILIDRFTDSTIAYQHYGMGINLDIIKYLNQLIIKKSLVDFTFLHTVSINNLKKRLKKRKILNRYDKFNDNFYSKAQKGFIKLSNKKSNYMIVNSNKSILDNKNLIISTIIKLLK